MYDSESNMDLSTTHMTENTEGSETQMFQSEITELSGDLSPSFSRSSRYDRRTMETDKYYLFTKHIIENTEGSETQLSRSEIIELSGELSPSRSCRYDR